MIDVTQQINAVRRQVGTRVLEAGEARTVTVSQSYDAAIEDVWDACTNPERIPRWFLPISGDLRPGGRYQLQGNAGGTVERCDPPESFAATWEFGDQLSWIEVRLMARPEGGTQLVLEHIAHVDDKLWAEFGPGAVGIGWDMGFVGLALHLSSGRSVDPQEGMAWAASAEGREFMTLASQRWCDASIAAGTDQADARAAAGRAIAAYTATGSKGGPPILAGRPSSVAVSRPKRWHRKDVVPLEELLVDDERVPDDVQHDKRRDGEPDQPRRPSVRCSMIQRRTGGSLSTSSGMLTATAW